MVTIHTHVHTLTHRVPQQTCIVHSSTTHMYSHTVTAHTHVHTLRHSNTAHMVTQPTHTRGSWAGLAGEAQRKRRRRERRERRETQALSPALLGTGPPSCEPNLPRETWAEQRPSSPPPDSESGCRTEYGGLQGCVLQKLGGTPISQPLPAS